MTAPSMSQANQPRAGEAGRPRDYTRTGLLLVLPCVVIALNCIVWATAVSRSGFWADDFLWVTHFSRSFGDLSNYRFNIGKYIINIFWAIGTEAFGAGSVVPFLVLNSLVFATGLTAWLWVGAKRSWSSVQAWWIGGLFIATTAWLPTTLWSSNITHSGGFFALGVGIFAHHRAMEARSGRDSTRWSMVGGAAWTFAVMSNLLYIGLVVLAAYCTWHQARRLRSFGMATPRAAAMVGFWNLLLPVLYFVAVGYPGTTASEPYSVTGLRFVEGNLRFYRSVLAPTDLLTATYLALLVGALIGAFVAVRRRSDLFPMAILGTVAATAVPALIQSQQRDIHYMAMPLLLLFSALLAGTSPMLLNASKSVKGTVLAAAVVSMLLIFRQGGELRAYFVRSPYGSTLLAFRSQVASLTPEGGAICVRMNLDAPQQTLLIAEMSGESGFLAPPISASQVYLVAAGEHCPAVGAAVQVAVSLDARGDFAASG